MNWRRGLIWLWVVASVVWLLYVVSELATTQAFDTRIREAFWSFVGLGLVPPLAVLVLGLIVARAGKWVLRGFKRA
jgi:hypothetical protein